MYFPPHFFLSSRSRRDLPTFPGDVGHPPQTTSPYSHYQFFLFLFVLIDGIEEGEKA
jgi:hypothetical protein